MRIGFCSGCREANGQSAAVCHGGVSYSGQGVQHLKLDKVATSSESFDFGAAQFADFKLPETETGATSL
jgi:hypothetical protein